MKSNLVFYAKPRKCWSEIQKLILSFDMFPKKRRGVDRSKLRRSKISMPNQLVKKRSKSVGRNSEGKLSNAFDVLPFFDQTVGWNFI